MSVSMLCALDDVRLSAAPALLLLLVLLMTVKFVCLILRYLRLRRRRRHKQRQRQEAFHSLAQAVSQVTQEHRASIVSLSLTELRAQLARGDVTPTQALQAFQAQALEVHKQTNCLMEPVSEAQTWASDLESQKSKDLPLYGIPVSLKDNYGIQGYDSTLGCSRGVQHPFLQDAVLVKVLKQQGAVPFVKTSVPQTMYSFETSNPIAGATTNPYTQGRIPGGSSGGEGALLAGRGSPLGFGSDLGGSIRIPAAFCGICGFKPTSHRVSSKGMHSLLSGQTIIPTDYGPLSRDVEGLVVAMRAVLVPLMSELDPAIPYMPFNDQVYRGRRPLKVGFYTYDGFFHAVPACVRAVKESVTALRNHGHQVVEWDFSRYGRRLMGYWVTAVMGDAGQGPLNLLAGDSVDLTVLGAQLMWSVNTIIRKIVASLPVPMTSNVRDGLRQSCGKGSISEWWNFTSEVQALREEVLTDWKRQGLDIVVCPGFTCPAMPHKLPAIVPGAASYTTALNVLLCPVGSVPVTKVTQADIEEVKNYPTPDPWHLLIKWAQHGSAGLPVGVQVAALPWQDELCLRVMKELETALKH